MQEIKLTTDEQGKVSWAGARPGLYTVTALLRFETPGTYKGVFLRGDKRKGHLYFPSHVEQRKVSLRNEKGPARTFFIFLDTTQPSATEFSDFKNNSESPLTFAWFFHKSASDENFNTIASFSSCHIRGNGPIRKSHPFGYCQRQGR